MISFEESAINTITEEHRRALEAIGPTNNWGCGPMGDNYIGLRGAFFKALGTKNRTPGQYQPAAENNSNGDTNEYFHPITRIRHDSLNYEPASLRGLSLQKPTAGAGWRWARNDQQFVPEYIMRPEKTMSLRYEESGTTKYRLTGSLSRIMCPKNVLLELDKDNSVQTGSA